MAIQDTLNTLDTLDFALDDLEDLETETTPRFINSSLMDFEPLCIPNDPIEEIGLWFVPNFSDDSISLESESFSTTPSCENPSLVSFSPTASCESPSFVSFPTTPEQDIESNAKKRSFGEDLHEVLVQENHVLMKKQRSKRSPKRVGPFKVKVLPPKRRSCTHCGTEETPQWRVGPSGPKTLCNACGVRYKSGRLVPEYRPAASPTFNSEMHSNSHKQIVKMRLTRDV
ncbi:hypothetical protein IFM89_001705 [Coptis chinensis]|uniref:GATA-type domain-containing protein n=1 Tax=Coptis chinensis TaxID=261450 RepID=A0A835HHX2_9MAGN|nr:hypothetical protein IFM89_001705 [Coptis chinensis]